MKGCIFSLGKIDKRIIWPFLFVLIQIAVNLIDKLFPRDKVNQIIDVFSISLGKMSVFIIPFLFKSKEKIIKKDEICTKNNIKYQAIFQTINFLFNLANATCHWTGRDVIFFSPHNSILSTREAVEIIILIIITMIFFKTKYHIHHLICLIIFCGLCPCIDLLLDSFSIEFSNRIPLNIISHKAAMILEIVQFCYMKYMMNTLYYHYWTLALSLGLVLLLFSSFSLAGAYIFGDKYNNKNFYYFYFQFLEKAEFKYSFPRFISWVIIYGLMQLFQLLSLESFTPNHMMISFELAKIYNILSLSKSDKKWYSIILFIFQFIILLFFLEIFEFNFCNLNKNTKRNIEERSLSTMDMRVSIDSVNNVEIDGYSIHEDSFGNTKEMSILNNEKEDDNTIN